MLKREEIEELMREGAEAFLAGRQPSDCRYRPLSDAYATWLRGYNNAAFGASMNQRSPS